jgi:hypothetical protein
LATVGKRNGELHAVECGTSTPPQPAANSTTNDSLTGSPTTDGPTTDSPTTDSLTTGSTTTNSPTDCPNDDGQYSIDDE